MKAVIMAGGEGSRLRPLTCDRPKPLVPVCNRPVIFYLLDLLCAHGFREVFLTLGYRPETISACLGDRYRNMRLHYVVEESPLGTAGGVAALSSHLDSTCVVMSGDALTDIDLSGLIDFHRNAGAVATLATTRVESPLEYGVVMTDRTGRVRRFLEKPGWGEVFSDTVNTGIYVLEPSVLRGVPRNCTYDFSQHLFPALLRMEAPLYAQVADGYWCDIGDPGAYLQANLDLLAGRMGFRPPGNEIVGGIWTMGEVPHGVAVEGPALIGEGCRLAAGTRLESGVVLGPGTVSGPGAVLRRTVTWSGVHIGTQAHLVGAVVCEGASVADGTGAYDGAVIGGNCRIGAKAKLAPGVRIWPGIEVGPGARVDSTLVQSPVWTGKLLRRESLEGRLGTDLFPENILRVGTAFASLLPGEGKLVVGSDPGAAAALLRQALLCGAAAAGRTVVDIGTTASPVTEFAILQQEALGGLHVRIHGEQARVVFYGSGGRPAESSLLRKLEQVCYRQDFLRATSAQAGTVESFLQAERQYLEHIGRLIRCDVIQSAGFCVEVEDRVWPIMDRWLERLGCKALGSGPRLRLRIEPWDAAWSVAGASRERMLALDIWLAALAASPDEGVLIPVTAPAAVEALLSRIGRRATRVKLAQWRCADPLLAVGRLLERMALEHLTLEDVLGQLPDSTVVERVVDCPWEAKGRVIRFLLEQHGGTAVDMVDGLRIRHEQGWALLLPDPDEPTYSVYAEARTPEEAKVLAEHYVRTVRDLIGKG